MTYWDKKLIREQLDKRLKSPLIPLLNSENGWIKLLREAFGMSTTQLAKRVGIDQSRISRIENAEIEGDLKLSTLKKVAKGLNMKFVYGFIPHESLENIVIEQAKKIAKVRIDRVNKTMRLEEQELSDTEKAKAFDDLAQKILIEDPKDFWDE
jgi:predicted DNA-binding mobile mystery protein A